MGVYAETGEANLLSTYSDNPENGAASAEIKRTGLVIEDGVPHVYGEDGTMICGGTPVINGKKYYVNSDGEAQTGWLRLADWQMYFDPETYQAATGITSIDGKTYLFDANGAEVLESRTEVVNGKKYWFQPDGTLLSGWCKLGDWTMYFDPVTYEGAVGYRILGGEEYYFDENCVLQNYACYQSYEIRGWYCTDQNGNLMDRLWITSAPERYGQTGWVTVNTYSGWTMTLWMDESGFASREYEDDYGNTGIIGVNFNLDNIIIVVSEDYRNPSAPYSPAELNGRIYYAGQ